MAKPDSGQRSFFRFDIDSSNPEVYVAGDVVSGKVVLESKIDQSVGKIIIQFSGSQSSELDMRNGSKIRESRELFNETSTLYSSRYTLRANIVYEWPFRFSFPESSTGTKSQPLLPTFQSFRQRIHRGTGHLMKVSYLLSAVLSRPEGASQKTGYKTEKPLMYFGLTLPMNDTHSESINISRETFNVKRCERESESSNQHLTFGQKVLLMFEPSRMPAAFFFELIIELPERIHIGQTIEGSLRLKYMSEAPYTHNMPVISLKSVEVQIKAISTMKYLDDKSSRETIMEVIQRNKDGIGPERFTEREDFCKRFPIGLKFGQDRVPSFHVHPIRFGAPEFNQKYLVKAKCELVCAGKTLKTKTEHNLTVLPGVLPLSLSRRGIEDLPSYEEAPSYDEAAVQVSEERRMEINTARDARNT